MTTPGLEILPERLWPAVRAGCSAADVHLMCSYPQCRCTKMPAAIEAAISAYCHTLGETGREDTGKYMTQAEIDAAPDRIGEAHDTD